MSRALAALLAVVVAFAPAAAAARHAWTKPGVLRIGVVRDLDFLNPLLSGQAGVTDLAQFIFSGLIRYDDRGEPIPDAATSVPSRANGGISADGRTITYHLRKNITFSDGHPLTAEDVVFTWQQVLNPNNNVPYHFPYDQADRVYAKDPYTVVAHLREPSAPFIVAFMRCGNQGVILPKHLLAHERDLNKVPYNMKPVGSGPFVVDRYQPGVGLELSANRRYWGGKPKLERVVYRIIPTENSLLIALQTHEIDFYFGAPEQQYKTLRAMDGMKVSAVPFSQYEQLTFNARRAPFDDINVRLAAAHAIDWEALARTVYLDVDLPGSGDIFPRSWAYDGNIRPYAHDVAKARELLERAGWKAGLDGIRVKDGKRLEVDIATVAGVIVRQNAEVLIQQQMREAGFDVQVRNAQASMLFTSFQAGGILATGKFDMGIYAWVKNPDPDDTETLAPDRVPPGGANYTGIRDPEIGRLQAAAAREYDRAKRKPLYARLQQRIHALLPFQTMVWRANIDAYNEDLQNFRPVPAVSDFWNVADWSI
ncbi:MAG: ABC transporter substrate-binding protein [Candidatus Velthaea sp.]